jgi:hypothetical protein
MSSKELLPFCEGLEIGIERMLVHHLIQTAIDVHILVLLLRHSSTAFIV